MVLADILVPKLSSSRIQIWFFSFFLLFAFLVWTRVAMLVFALFTAGDYVPLDHFMKSLISEPSYVAMAVVGSLIGGGIAFIIFAVSVIAVPMLLDRDVDAFTAMGRSLMAVRENFRPMLLWAWLIAVFVLIGFLTLTLGMIILFPLLGHASWHCYRQVASAP
ncbi:MAG: DUF2189 domain-containing protein [Alphaproteobacteria bacterium]|nr:DUF2189 domain-containing protein [Alphaproteobacteria bacterium]